ncbi:hypothetical protein STEG23_011535 [Scotinomys teguina]
MSSRRSMASPEREKKELLTAEGKHSIGVVSNAKFIPNRKREVILFGASDPIQLEKVQLIGEINTQNQELMTHNCEVSSQTERDTDHEYTDTFGKQLARSSSKAKNVIREHQTCGLLASQSPVSLTSTPMNLCQ